jgi:hypothetical protein
MSYTICDVPGVEEVEFTGSPRWVDMGIGQYEFWGAKCVQTDWQPSMEYSHVDFDRSKYTEEQNALIEYWLDQNYDEVCDKLCDNFISTDTTDGQEEPEQD